MDQQPDLPVYRDGGAVYTRVIGPVDRQTIPFFQQRLEGVTRERCYRLTLDLGPADYIDSDGVRWLQRLQAAMIEQGIELRLAIRNGCRAERTLRLLRMEGAFPLDRYPTDEQERPAAPASCS